VTDLQYLRESGIAARILALLQHKETQLVGICGGFQMLGMRILDPQGLESEFLTYEGLGLLRLETSLLENKRLSQTRGIHSSSGCAVVGYEIHHGVTQVLGAVPIAFISERGETLGHCSENEQIWGTYLHGVFDSDEFRRQFLNRVRHQKGLLPLPVTNHYNLEAGIDELASHVRESLDMKAIYKKLRI
jgi:cobyric acid synthase